MLREIILTGTRELVDPDSPQSLVGREVVCVNDPLIYGSVRRIQDVDGVPHCLVINYRLGTMYTLLPHTLRVVYI